MNVGILNFNKISVVEFFSPKRSTNVQNLFSKSLCFSIKFNMFVFDNLNSRDSLHSNTPICHVSMLDYDLLYLSLRI